MTADTPTPRAVLMQAAADAIYAYVSQVRRLVPRSDFDVPLLSELRQKMVAAIRADERAALAASAGPLTAEEVAAKCAEAALTLSTLRQANVDRNAHWDGEGKLTLSFRGCELAGEVGEVCNVVKKIERQRLGLRGSRDSVEHLAEELADVIICADLIGMAAGIDLGKAVTDKFNATSTKLGLPVLLARTPTPEGQG